MNTGNVIEDNSVEGNSIGIIVIAGVQGEIVRRNYVVGNPPLEVAVTNPSSGPAADIVNLASAGANTFASNVCLTAMNAPCGGFEASFTASPNPIPVTTMSPFGMTTLRWTVSTTDSVEIRIGAPNGALLAGGGSRGTATTGLWVSDGMTFYLQDVGGGKPLTAENTLAALVIRLQRR
jgi:hypothetical protein